MTSEKSVSRRRLIIGGLTATAGAVLADLSGVTFSAEPSLPVLSVMPETASDFDDALRRHFPKTAADPDFQQGRKLALILTNPGSVPIRAVSVRWNVKNFSHEHEQTLFLYRSDERINLIAAHQPFLLPEETRLITPFASVSNRRGEGRANWSDFLSREGRSRRLMSLLEDQGAVVETSLVATLYHDWRITGPMSLALGKHILWRRKAFRSVATQALADLKAGGRPEDVLKALREVEPMAPLRAAPQPKKHGIYYQRMQARYSRLLAARLRSSRNRASFVNLLERGVNQRPVRPRYFSS